MGSKDDTFHIIFFPFLAHGHMIPMIDMAKLFVARGVKVTIVTTPLNATFISKVIGKSKTHNYEIHIRTIELPFAEAGLPDGCEKIDLLPSPDLIPIFIGAMRLLQKPFEQVLMEQNPDCIMSDIFFQWTTEVAAKFGIPRIMFHGSSLFASCAMNCIARYQPYKIVSSDSEPFVIPDLPGEIKMTKLQLADVYMTEGYTKFTLGVEEKIFGVVFNSFYELEHDYADYYRNLLGKKTWLLGPLFLCNKDHEEKACRGKEASIDEHECIKWLDTKKPNSVIFLCFGSEIHFQDSQLRNIAMGLEASEQQFIWAVKKRKKGSDDGEEDAEEWLPEGFEKRMEWKGLIIRGWVPQLLILEHEAVGAFVTHCGWNSTLEGVTAGVPMVTWPLAAEQFFNEKLVTDVLKIGVSVGAKKGSWPSVTTDSDNVEWDVVERVVKRIMVGEEAEDFRNRAKVLSQRANVAMKEGGYSYSDLDALIEELFSSRH